MPPNGINKNKTTIRRYIIMKETNEKLVAVNYKNVVYFITESEYKDLMNGYLSFSDMFD